MSLEDRIAEAEAGRALEREWEAEQAAGAARAAEQLARDVAEYSPQIAVETGSYEVVLPAPVDYLYYAGDETPTQEHVSDYEHLAYAFEQWQEPEHKPESYRVEPVEAVSETGYQEPDEDFTTGQEPSEEPSYDEGPGQAEEYRAVEDEFENLPTSDDLDWLSKFSASIVSMKDFDLEDARWEGYYTDVSDLKEVAAEIGVEIFGNPDYFRIGFGDGVYYLWRVGQ